MKADGLDRPAGVNEMMEPQRPGHDDGGGGGGDVRVPLGRVRLGGIFKNVGMDLNVQK